MTPHNEAKMGEIAKTVLMAGDPLRVKYIAENFMENCKLVNTVRGMYCYTGTYKGKEISVMAHGMGIPSMGIYTYELYHIYNVDTIIRVGSCGGYSDDIKLLDTILVDKTYTESNYAYSFDNVQCKLAEADQGLNGNTLCNDCFDVYVPDKFAMLQRAPKELNIIACEMEAFALFYNAKREHKRAACLLTVVDTPRNEEGVSSKERETSLNDMIVLALETAITLN